LANSGSVRVFLGEENSHHSDEISWVHWNNDFRKAWEVLVDM